MVRGTRELARGLDALVRAVGRVNRVLITSPRSRIARGVLSFAGPFPSITPCSHRNARGVWQPAVLPDYDPTGWMTLRNARGGLVIWPLLSTVTTASGA